MLTKEQRAALEDEAKRAGVDPAELIKEAESMSASGVDTNAGDKQPKQSGEQPKLFMYLLPFVTVKEVRSVWLGLTDSFSGDSEVASAWAAKQGATTSTPPADE